MTNAFDLVVAGAGPAGLAASIQAAQAGLGVAVLDPHGGVIDKACGEGLMPGGVEALEDLGIRPHGYPFIGIRYADAVDPTLDAYGTFPEGTGLGVRRTVLHVAMKQRAMTLGVQFLEKRAATFEQRPDGVLVNGELFGRWLIAADGLRSQIRRSLGVELPPRRHARLGLRRHYTVRPWSDRVEVYFADDAEAYVTPIDAKLVGVAFLFEQHTGEEPGAARFDDLLGRFPLLAEHLVNKPIASRLRGAGPFEQRVSRHVVGDVLLVGDAAGYLDPLTGEGVALGLATAKAAVESILEDDASAYEQRYRDLTGRYFALTSSLLAATSRPALRRSLLHLARALPGVFDAALGTLAHLTPEDSHPSSTSPGDDLTIGLDRLL